jgi:hypothetical protein
MHMSMNSFEIIVIIELNTCSLYYMSLLAIWISKKCYGCKWMWGII